MSVQKMVLGLLGAVCLLIIFTLLISYGLSLGDLDVSEDKKDQSSSLKETSVKTYDWTKLLPVSFTTEIYPQDQYISQPRLRRHVAKLQNNSDQIVSSIALIVKYLDDKNKTIYEDRVNLTGQIKPNFIKEFTFGGAEVPGDWSGSVDYYIETVRIEGESRNDYYPVHNKSDSVLDRPIQRIMLDSIF